MSKEPWESEDSEESPQDRLFKLLEGKISELFKPAAPLGAPFVWPAPPRRPFQHQEQIARLAVEILAIATGMNNANPVILRDTPQLQAATLAAFFVWDESGRLAEGYALREQQQDAEPQWLLLRRAANAAWCDAWTLAHPDVVNFPDQRMAYLDREHPVLSTPAPEHPDA